MESQVLRCSSLNYSKQFTEELSSLLRKTYYEDNSENELKAEETEQAIAPFKPLALRVVCTLCKKSYIGVKGLRQHQAKIHCKVEKTSTCLICGKNYKHKNAVRFHQRQVHDKTTRVNCPVCFHLIYNKYMLKKHLSTHFPLTN